MIFLFFFLKKGKKEESGFWVENLCHVTADRMKVKKYPQHKMTSQKYNDVMNLRGWWVD